jgi:hypothetical protein
VWVKLTLVTGGRGRFPLRIGQALLETGEQTCMTMAPV